MMSKISKIISSIGIALISCLTLLTATACDFNVSYKDTSNKLNAAIEYLDASVKFASGNVNIDGTKYNYESVQLPVVTCKTTHNEDYQEIEKYYDSVFAYAINYVVYGSKLIAQKPTVETLTEKQEEYYKTLNNEINNFSSATKTFENEIDNFNRYYNNISSYGESSKEVYHLNYKKAYRTYISTTFKLINAMDVVTSCVYTGVNYKEINPEVETYKSIEKSINVKLMQGYFNFLVDSFDCRIPTETIDSNEYMKKIVATYASAKTEYIKVFKQMIDGASKSITLTDNEISNIINISERYFEEMEIFKTSYSKLDFKKFYFDDDCKLNVYVAKDYANQNYYDKIVDYLNYTLPSFTGYLKTSIYK